METITEETTEVRILIYENTQEIDKIRNEVKTRLDILKRILASGLKHSQIASITENPFSIGKYILEMQLSENSKLKELYDAGISGVTAELPEHLQRLKDDLTTWHNYKAYTTQNKFGYLKVDEVSAEIDNGALENYFTQRQLKVFIEGEKLAEFRELQMICGYFERNKMPSNQIRESSFLWSRLEPVGREKCKPRWQWFVRERN